ncbi:MAG: hypothetical protein AABY33_09890 [Pseudomonadota bacterium]
MDDKTFIAEYAANEILRINERLKTMVESKTVPSDEVRDSVISDIENTLRRLQSALSNITEDMEENKEDKKQ